LYSVDQLPEAFAPAESYREKRTSTAEKRFPPAASTATPSVAPTVTPAEAKSQKVYIKISADQEQSSKLQQLKSLLLTHSGPLEVILYYEQSQKTIALSRSYTVKPSPDLFQAVEALFGKDTVKVR
jgi:DNA polymerase-3 subunit alpha